LQGIMARLEEEAIHSAEYRDPPMTRPLAKPRSPMEKDGLTKSPNYQVQRPAAAAEARGRAEVDYGRTLIARGRALYARPVRCNAELGGDTRALGRVSVREQSDENEDK
jgi:hypothetical protein